jgi:hypothetical protein
LFFWFFDGKRLALARVTIPLLDHASAILRSFRRLLPKMKDFATITPKQLKEIEDFLNNRSRKVMDYRNSHGVLNEHGALALSIWQFWESAAVKKRSLLRKTNKEDFFRYVQPV